MSQHGWTGRQTGTARIYTVTRLLLTVPIAGKAIITAKNRSAQISIFDVPTGICFFGTPHRGAKSAKWGELGNNLSNAVRLGQGGGRNSSELRFFCNTVSDIHSDFVLVSRDFEIISFIENVGCRGIGLVCDRPLTNSYD